MNNTAVEYDREPVAPRFTRFPHVKANAGATLDATRETLDELLQAEYGDKKQQPLFFTGVFPGNTRKASTPPSGHWGFAVDFDDVDFSLEQLKQRMSQLFYQCYLYETYSHGVKGNRLRCLFVYDCERSELEQKKITLKLQAEFKDASKETWHTKQGFFLGRPTGEPRTGHWIDGYPIDALVLRPKTLGGFDRVHQRYLAMRGDTPAYVYLTSLAMSLAHTDADVDEELRTEDDVFFGGRTQADHPRDFERAIESALQKAAKQLVAKTQPPETDEPSQLVSVSYRDAILRNKDKKVEWAVNELLTFGGASLVIGAAKIGKSMLTYELVSLFSCGSGTLFGMPDYAVTTAAKVLHISLEDGEARSARRFVDLHGDRPWKFEPELVTKWAVGMNAVDALDDYLDRHDDIKVVVIDTLLALTLAEGETLEEAKRKNRGVTQDQYNMIVRFNELAQQRNVALVIIHHAKKGAGKEADIMDRVNGTMGMVAAVDGVWTLTGIPNPQHKLAAFDYKHRDARNQTTFAVEMGDAGRWHFYGTVEEAKMTDNQVSLLELVERLEKEAVDRKDPNPCATSTDLAAALGKTKDATLKALQRLADKGLLASVPGVGFKLPDNTKSKF